MFVCACEVLQRPHKRRGVAVRRPGFLGGPHASLHPCRMCRRWARLTQNRPREPQAQGARQASTQPGVVWKETKKRAAGEREKEGDTREPESPILPTFTRVHVSKNRSTGTQQEVNGKLKIATVLVCCSYLSDILVKSGSANVTAC